MSAELKETQDDLESNENKGINKHEDGIFKC